MTEQKPLARVDNTYLFETDVISFLPVGLSGGDSASLAEKLIDDWVKKQLLMSRAKAEIAYDENLLERKVQDYRYNLIVHEFEKFYINAHLSKEVSQKEIETYYEERAENFTLKQNIVRCLYIKMPLSFQGINQLRRNVRSYPNVNKEDITEVCYQYAAQSFLEDSIWVNFDEVIINTPLKGLSNKIQFLEKTTFSETRDDQFAYFLRVLDYKFSDQVPPLEYVREDIVNIIINKRKLALKKELEKAVYEEAKKSNRFEVFAD